MRLNVGHRLARVEVGAQIFFRDVPGRLPDDGAKGSSVELLVQRNDKRLLLAVSGDSAELDVTSARG